MPHVGFNWGAGGTNNQGQTCIESIVFHILDIQIGRMKLTDIGRWGQKGVSELLVGASEKEDRTPIKQKQVPRGGLAWGSSMDLQQELEWGRGVLSPVHPPTKCLS